jgi:peptide subunit release factor RF-3
MWSLINSSHVAPLIFGVSLNHYGIDCNKLASFVALAATVMKIQVF